MSQRRRQSPQLETLEGKLMLSTAHPAAAKLAASKLAAATPAPQFTLAGTLQVPTSSIVTFTQNGENMGSFKVRGKLGTMGQVTGTFVAILDSTSQYMSAGGLVLKGRTGSVTLAMSSDPNDSTSYDFNIFSGTGAFATASGSGKMSTQGVANNGRTMLFNITMS
jgi:hypothetical protein